MISSMGYNRNKRGGRGGDKWDNFGGESAEPFKEFGGSDGAPRSAPRQYDDEGSRGGPRRGGGGAGGGLPAQVVGTSSGEVKFFNGQKGFGFVCCDDRPDDVFVHISAVEQAGLTGLAEGQKLKFTLVERNGRVSATELEIDGDIIPVESRSSSPRQQEGPRHGADRPQRAKRELTGESDSGVVKFFNGEKGFGFIERDSGQADAFVHISTVERDGLGQLNEGDRLQFDIEVNDRGKYAAVNLQRA